MKLTKGLIVGSLMCSLALAATDTTTTNDNIVEEMSNGNKNIEQQVVKEDSSDTIKENNQEEKQIVNKENSDIKNKEQEEKPDVKENSDIVKENKQEKKQIIVAENNKQKIIKKEDKKPNNLKKEVEEKLSRRTVDSFDGYSYFAVGVENFRYSEKFLYTFHSAYTSVDNKTYIKGEQVAVKSKIDTYNPVYMSGNLIKINDNFDFSMDFASTLKPNVTTEQWLDRGDDSVIVENKATIMSNSMKFLFHYKLSNKHRLTTGLSYSLNIFKRFNDADATTTELVEETSASAIWNFGYWFENKSASVDGFRIKYELTGGLPIYQNVKNTAAPDLTFTNKKGFNFDTSLYLGYKVYKGVEVGLFGSYSYMYRDGETKEVKKDGKVQEVIWPTNITQTARYGLQVTWKFEE